MLKVSILPLSTTFLLDYGTIPTVWYFVGTIPTVWYFFYFSFYSYLKQSNNDVIRKRGKFLFIFLSKNTHTQNTIFISIFIFIFYMIIKIFLSEIHITRSGKVDFFILFCLFLHSYKTKSINNIKILSSLNIFLLTYSFMQLLDH